jgi:hypothetical protein
MRFFCFIFLLPIVLLSATFAKADLDERCQYDQLKERSEAIGRNQWALKCGYIKSNSMVAAMNAEGTYIVFTNGRFGGGRGNKDVPASADASCVDGLIKQGFCFVGCYTPAQKLDFDGSDLGIAEAHAAQISHISSMTVESSPAELSFSAQKIKSFVAGKTAEDIIVITTDKGQEVQVTSDHPMVDEKGIIVKARDIAVGSSLLGADGEPSKVIARKTMPYQGEVWNVRPASTNKQENILIVEGLLTGSHRFQSQWSEELTRLFMRSEADISGL